MVNTPANTRLAFPRAPGVEAWLEAGGQALVVSDATVTGTLASGKVEFEEGSSFKVVYGDFRTSKPGKSALSLITSQSDTYWQKPQADASRYGTFEDYADEKLKRLKHFVFSLDKGEDEMVVTLSYCRITNLDRKRFNYIDPLEKPVSVVEFHLIPPAKDLVESRPSKRKPAPQASLSAIAASRSPSLGASSPGPSPSVPAFGYSTVGGYASSDAADGEDEDEEDLEFQRQQLVLTEQILRNQQQAAEVEQKLKRKRREKEREAKRARLEGGEEGEDGGRGRA
ncbi:hypothetical protein JCM10213_002394 [Rhodosporidiobolus nylandii]